ncbi:MAG: hypothetical protein EHM36_01990, partial [Deltaproteobacteria bacterium]
MADDINVKYGSTGFEKINRELDLLHGKGAAGGGWFRPVAQSLRDAEGSATGFTGGLKTMLGAVTNLGVGLTGIIATLGALTALTAGGATAAFMKFGHSILETTENFRKFETSLLGALKSEAAVERVSNFAKDYASKYPAMYGDIMRAMQGLAFIPATRGAIREGDTGMMKDFMHIVQGMMVMRPDQGVQGSLWALREALAGNLRSLQYRFDIPVASIARSAGMSLGEMKEDPMKMLKGMKAWVDDFVGSDTMEKMSRTIGVQLGNIKDKWQMWLDTVGKTGVYDTVVSYIYKMNTAFEAFLKTEKAQEWAMRVSDLFSEVADKLASIFTKGIDWGAMSGFGDFLENVRKVFGNAKDEALKVWAEIKEPLSNFVNDAFTWALDKVMPIVVEGFLKLGAAAGSSFASSVKDAIDQNPWSAVLIGGLGGGAIAGPKGAALGAAVGGAWGVANVLADQLAKWFGWEEIEGAAAGAKDAVLNACHTVEKAMNESVTSISGGLIAGHEV